MKTILQYYPKFTVSRGGGLVHILNIVNNLSDYNFKLITNAAPGKPVGDGADLYAGVRALRHGLRHPKYAGSDPARHISGPRAVFCEPPQRNLLERRGAEGPPR